MWIDSHNHLQDPRLLEKERVIEEMKAAGIQRCIVNATCEEDWAEVELLAITHPGFIVPAFGIHPWKAHTVRPGWQDRLRSLLDTHPTASIGECGLDQWISEPAIARQKPVFIDQIHLARELDRALTIHCLKAWGPLFEAFAEAPPPRRFLMHSFNGSIETARRLIPLGAYFSFSGYFLHERKSAVVDVFRHLPLERILMETDAPDMSPPGEQISHPLPDKCNHPANLPAIGRALATALSMTPAALARLTDENSQRCFGTA
jgi:TatD DNase family protein